MNIGEVRQRMGQQRMGRQLAVFLWFCGLFQVARPVRAEEAPTGPEARGAVLVMPAGDSAMPDIAALVKELNDAGFKTPGYQTEFLDGRRLLNGLGDGIMLLTSSETRVCDNETRNALKSGGDARVVEPGAALSAAERAIFLTRWDDAARWLEQARSLLPCLIEPVSNDVLYRIYFLQGVTAYYREEKSGSAKGFKEARRAFEQALATAPERDWDQSYAPPAWAIFLQAKEALAKKSRVTFRHHLSSSGARLWVDGRPLEDIPLSLPVGEHLIQVQAPTNGDHPTYHAWLVAQGPESVMAPVWITDSSSLRRAEVLFSDPPEVSLRQMLIDLLLRWAHINQRSWLLVVSPATADQVTRFVYIDAQQNSATAPPAWLRTSDADERTITLPGSRKVAVPQALYGWHVTGGFSMYQQLSQERARLMGIEVGGFRQIKKRLEARVALGLGGVTQATFPVRFYQAIHLGLRQSWEAHPFGVFAEGGFLGCRCKTQGSIGLEARGGTYYKLDPRGKNAIEAVIGGGIVFSDELLLGQFGINYQRAF